MTDLVAWLHRNADDCEDQSRWATPELAPFLREAATALEAKDKELADWKLLAKSRGEVLVSAIEQMKEAQARAETAERELAQTQAHLAMRNSDLAEAERGRDEARAALKPFSDAADSLSEDHLDRMDLWESPAGMDITAGHLRAARAVMED